MKTKFLYVILCLTFLLWGSQLLAQTITVTNNNNSGAGSLRKALSDAKTSATNPITIKFSAAVTTITISSHLPINRNLTRSIIIDGEGRVTLKRTGTGATALIKGNIICGTVNDAVSILAPAGSRSFIAQ